jgi:hypothetical protein
VNENELKEFLGVVGFQRYSEAPDSDQPKIVEWCQKLAVMTDSEFIMETASRILDDAIMQSFPRFNNNGTYARSDGCFEESKRRFAKAGHAKNCDATTLYDLGLNSALRNQGHKTKPVRPCECGAVKK